MIDQPDFTFQIFLDFNFSSLAAGIISLAVQNLSAANKSFTSL